MHIYMYIYFGSYICTHNVICNKLSHRLSSQIPSSTQQLHVTSFLSCGASFFTVDLGLNRVVTDPTLAALCRLWSLRQSKWDGLPHPHLVILGSPFVPLVATERDNVPSLLSDPSRSGRDSIPEILREPSGGGWRLNRVVESKKIATRALRCISKLSIKKLSLLKEPSQKQVWNLQQRFQNTSYLPEEAQQLLLRNSVRHITSVKSPLGSGPSWL